eukprot:Opistho-1_new@29777
MPNAEDDLARPRYFTPSEVEMHSTPTDCWVSFLGRVYDLTSLCEENQGSILLKPIVMFAGKDISHWFDPKTGDVKTCIDSESGQRIPYTPYGRFIDVPPKHPRSDWVVSNEKPWWRKEKLCIGFLSRRTRKVRVINTLTSQEQIVEVCTEETIEEIQRRYLKYNSHAASYTWKYMGKALDMQGTLEMNGIYDEGDEFSRLAMDEDEFLPAIHVYFNDDLTVD